MKGVGRGLVFPPRFGRRGLPKLPHPSGLPEGLPALAVILNFSPGETCFSSLWVRKRRLCYPCLKRMAGTSAPDGAKLKPFSVWHDTAISSPKVSHSTQESQAVSSTFSASQSLFEHRSTRTVRDEGVSPRRTEASLRWINDMYT